MLRTYGYTLVALTLLMGTVPAGAFTLVADGQPQATIVTADQPTPSVTLAVTELNYWVERISGVRLPVVTHAAWDGQGPVLAIGPSPFTQKERLEVAGLGPEGARVVITDNFIAVLGRDDPLLENLKWYGTYYAVMELVKRSFGVRFIWPGQLGEVFTPRATLKVDPGAWTWETPLVLSRSLRNTYTARDSRQQVLQQIGMTIDDAAWQGNAAATSRWLQRQRMNKPSNVAFGHSFTAWWDRHGVQHPDWFAKPPGNRPRPGGKGQKLCVSNPALRQQVFDEWYAAWKADPAANKALRACPNDSRGYCTCPTCREWDGPDQAKFTDDEVYSSPDARVSDRYARFWSDLAERVVAVDPEGLVTGYAYRSYRQPPQHTRIHPSVVVGYVGGEGFYPQEPHVRDEWQRWAEAGAKLHWRPNLLWCGHGAPYVFARELGEDFKFFHRHKMMGTDFDSLQGAWATQGPNYYVLAELHSRPEADVDGLLREFYSAFGPAAGEVAAYFGYWEDVTRRGPVLLEKMLRPASLTWGQWFPGFITLVPRLYTDDVLADGETLLKRAEEKTAGDQTVRARVAFLREGLDHTRLMAAALRELQLLQAKDPAADVSRLIAAREALRSFRIAHAASMAIPAYDLTARELTYKNTAGLWLTK